MKVPKICRINFGFFAHFRVLLALPTFVFPNGIEAVNLSVSPQVKGCGESCPVCTPKQLKSLAQSITVKIFSEQGWGSGILLQKQGTVYTIITNQHVVFYNQETYKIQAPDGQFYLAHYQMSSGLPGSDLAILRFNSLGKNYAIASLASSKMISIGDKVFGGGFPWDGESLTEKITDFNLSSKPPLSKFNLNRNSSENPDHLSLSNFALKKDSKSKFSHPLNSQKSEALGFRLTQGRVSLLPEKAIQHGYQIGYTNPIQKGMSGGPLLNHQGYVIGINGMHAYPLWGNPYTYEDGSQPSPILQKQMSELAFAIPIERLTDLISNLTTLLPQSSYLNDQRYSLPFRDYVPFYPRSKISRNKSLDSLLRRDTKRKDGETSCELFQPKDEGDPGV